jgi:dihydrofolate reductase
MKVTLYMAMSLNGYIAEENGNEDFLSHVHWETFCNLAQKYGNVIVGRKTYEAVKAWDGGFNFDDLKGVQKVVISRDENYKLDDGYILATSPKDALEKLKGFESILVSGGSTINTAFIKENSIDEVIFNIEPVLVGNGIPLFDQVEFSKNLQFVSADQLNGIVTLHYSVSK